MATAKPMRLSKSLVEAAEKAGIIYHRSAPKQIEFWAELGRNIEHIVNLDDILGVIHGLKQFKIEPFESVGVEPKEVFETLEKYRAQGELSKRVMSCETYYEASRGHPGLLDRVNRKTGERQTGQFRNGAFEERI
jgi:hypothetical protein